MIVFVDAPVGAIVLTVVGAVVWIFVGGFHAIARVREAREADDQASPTRHDFGARQLKLIEWSGFAVMIAGLAWYVFD